MIKFDLSLDITLLPDDTTVNTEFMKIFYLLLANQIEDACNLCITLHNYRLALLLSQFGHNTSLHIDIAKQIQIWENLT